MLSSIVMIILLYTFKNPKNVAMKELMVPCYSEQPSQAGIMTRKCVYSPILL